LEGISPNCRKFQEAERTVPLCYRQLIMRQMNEQLVAERIAAANHTGDKFDPIQHIYLSPDRFSKIDQHHSIADKMGEVRFTAPGARKQQAR
jgi:hypothetical protein